MFKKAWNWVKGKLVGSTVVATTVVASVSAHAADGAIDVTGAVTGISQAQTAILAVIGALLAMSIAIFGLAKVYTFIKRKAGA